jgi:hypothetical protein
MRLPSSSISIQVKELRMRGERQSPITFLQYEMVRQTSRADDDEAVSDGPSH